MIKVTSNLKIFAFLISFLSFASIFCIGQTNESTPYLRTEHAIKPLYFSFINPSFPTTKTRINATLGYQAGTNEARRRIRSFYANTLVRISQKDSLGQAHFLGLGLSSSQEGPLLTQNELAVKYEIRFPINQYSLIKSGIDVGIFNYDIGSSGKNGGISVFVPNGRIGITYLYKELTQVGVSMNQIFNTTFEKGTSQPTQLTRHYNFHVSHQFQTNLLHHFGFFVWNKYVPSILNRFGGYVSYSYQSKLSISMGLDNDLQAIFSLGVTNWELTKNNVIDIFMGYAVPLLPSGQNFGNIEFGIKHRLL